VIQNLHARAYIETHTHAHTRKYIHINPKSDIPVNISARSFGGEHPDTIPWGCNRQADGRAVYLANHFNVSPGLYWLISIVGDQVRRSRNARREAHELTATSNGTRTFIIIYDVMYLREKLRGARRRVDYRDAALISKWARSIARGPFILQRCLAFIPRACRVFQLKGALFPVSEIRIAEPQLQNHSEASPSNGMEYSSTLEIPATINIKLAAQRDARAIYASVCVRQCQSFGMIGTIRDMLHWGIARGIIYRSAGVSGNQQRSA